MVNVVKYSSPMEHMGYGWLEDDSFPFGILHIFRCENVMLVSGRCSPKKPDPSILICHLINHDPFKHFGTDQWLFLVPLKGGIGGI